MKRHSLSAVLWQNKLTSLYTHRCTASLNKIRIWNTWINWIKIIFFIFQTMFFTFVNKNFPSSKHKKVFLLHNFLTLILWFLWCSEPKQIMFNSQYESNPLSKWIWIKFVVGVSWIYWNLISSHFYLFNRSGVVRLTSHLPWGINFKLLLSLLVN